MPDSTLGRDRDRSGQEDKWHNPNNNRKGFGILQRRQLPFGKDA